MLPLQLDKNKLLNKLSNNIVAEVGLEPTTSCTV